MSTFLEVEDQLIGPVVLDLQPTVVEVFRARDGAFRRVHLAPMHLEVQGPNKKGFYDVVFSMWGNLVTYVTVDGDGYALLHPWLEQVLARQAELKS